MKLKEAQSRAIAEHGELALITVDNQQSNPQERIALRPPILQVVRLASFQHAPSIPPFLSLPRQSKVDGDASSVLKEMEARKANEVAVGGGGVAVAVTRFPAEQARPVGPLVIVGVRDGVLCLIDRYMCAHAISLSHPGIHCRCLAAYGDAVSAVKWASRLGREHHDDLAQFMLGMGYATEALHLPGISKRLEFDLALQMPSTMSNSRDIGQETVGLDLNDLMNMTKKKENVVEAVQGLIDAADATAQADIAREALKRLAAAGSIKGALRGQELRGVALRLANHGELTRLSNLVNNLISVGAGREAAFAAALLGDNVLMEKAWQETGMLAEAAHGRPSMRTLVQSWNKMLQKEMEHTPSMKTDAAAAFLASLEGPKLTSLADAATKPPIEILPPGMSRSSQTSFGEAGLPQPGKPLLLEGSKTTAPITSVPAGSNTSATSESGVPPKSENGASTTPESSNPPASDSGAAPAADSGAAPPSETGAAPTTETGAAPPATETGATPPVIESGAAPTTETGASPAESSTIQTSNLDSSVAADAIVPATPALNESDYLASVEPTTIGAIVPSTSATGPPPATDNKKPSIPDERLMIDFS
ncbi:hypothetical protein H5410_010158 [Solanum commersonii]|uniref:Uncharacterized protein n=1 Tax=Solanum commersonii TaxID=4109 RepID=A0A9J6AKU2_SOLCO|nr:hypothetical protein H5410_010158 [Solanum commersonii]